MAEPLITIDLEKIEHNARTLTRLCANHNISITGVSKVACGNPDVARAMLRGGVASIGESRMRNIHRLKANGVNSDFMLLRTPPLSDPDAIVTSVDVSLNSELSVIAALSESALRRCLVHNIMIMLDLGDLREGVLPDDLFTVARDIIELEGIRIVGLGTNLSCYGGVIPSCENMGLLAQYAEELEQRFNLRLRYVSGGNSSSLDLVASGMMPRKINHLRLGESILLGRETINRNPVPDTFQDGFVLSAEIIELKKKPSLPIGETAQDAFGNTPVFEDRGEMLRAILNVGREDIDVDGIAPVDPRLSILGASSDHLLVDVTGSKGEVRLGDSIAFSLNYSALLAGMTSSYVDKRCLGQDKDLSTPKGVTLLYPATRPGHRGEFTRIVSTLPATFRQMGLEPSLQPLTLPAELPGSETSYPAQLTAGNQTLNITAEPIRKALGNRQFPILLSTQPCWSRNAYFGLPQGRENFGLIVFSAHGGFQQPGDPDGADQNRMVLGSALGLGTAGDCQLFKAENVVLIGLRNLTDLESMRIGRSMIHTHTMEDIDSLGMKEVCYRALRAAAIGTAGVHVTFDMSIMDWRESSCILDPVFGGITFREAHLAMEILSLSGILRSADFTGFCQEIGTDEQTSAIVSGLILSLCGKRILGRAR